MPKNINTEYDIGKAFEAIEDELISSMIRNMKRHKAEETEEGIQWGMWQAEQLKSLEKYKKANEKKYKGIFEDINKKIGVLISIANSEGQMSQEVAILKAIKDGFKAKRVSKGIYADFFRLNERKLEALIKATNDDMKRAETAILRQANDKYRQIIFNAQVYANSGAGTYEKAVDMATRDMLEAGLNCVEYSNGARHRLAEYADMAIRTASKRAYLQGEGTKRQEWGISTVIMNKRGNPCPKCLPFCGKVLIDDVWSGGKDSDGPYPLVSKAIEHGLYHPRCKDSHTTYFPGISTADDTWTERELQEIGIQSKQEAKQQYAKRQNEKFSRLAKYSLDKDNRKKYETKTAEWEEQSDSMLQQIKKHFQKRSVENIVEEFEKHLKTVKDIDVKTLLKQSTNRVKIDVSSRRTSYFSSKDQKVYLSHKASKSSVAHELFHEIDNTYGISESGILTNPVRKDFRRLTNLAKGYGAEIEDMLYSKYPDMFVENELGERVVRENFRGLSDVLNGMSGGEIHLGYGHTRDYWSKKLKVEKETWAQYGRMLYEQDEEVLKILEDIFPETTKTVNQILKGMIK